MFGPEPNMFGGYKESPEAWKTAPEELTRDRLRRIGEGIGKVVYASEHWVVKRERSPAEVVALIIIWRGLKRWSNRLPFGLGRRWLTKKSAVIGLISAVLRTAMIIVPRSIWFTRQVGSMWTIYRARNRRGERLAERVLAGTGLIPRRILFPPVTVLVSGFPGWLTVREATERVDTTLDKLLQNFAKQGDFEAVEQWLHRSLETRNNGWRYGLFSTDAHLKNFGVIDGRIVLLDAGGLTDRWQDIEERLDVDERIEEPHKALGLEDVFESHPEIAARFDERWRALVNRDRVALHFASSGAADES
jgi:hypothetical protein